MNCKNKSFMTKRKAFTLIELLIVIAIIGILFIVLVSKVDFATDKAKATGVQTDFRSFQVAIESVAKENAGLATFGWDTGDSNGNRIRDSYDKGDTNKNGVQDDGKVFIGSKEYSETWTNVYTLTNPADANDKSAIVALETAINANLDPKLHITIHDDYTITMANGAQDPWNTEYHGYYITNATVDNKDRGAIVIYSNGANQEFGSEHSIAGGVVTVNVPGNNVYGKDDYGMSVIYTYVNGYGEVKTTTSGFSVNQGGGQAGTDGTFIPGNGGSNGDEPGNGNTNEPGEPTVVLPVAKSDLKDYTWSELNTLAQANLSADELRDTYGIEVGDYKEVSGVKYVLVDLNSYGGFVFMYNADTSLVMNSTSTNAGGYASSKLAPQVEALYTNLTDSDLKAAIKEVTITCNDGKANYTATHPYTAHMFLASAKEVGFNVSGWTYPDGCNAEGTCFDLFTTDNSSRTGFMSTANISSSWWLRSAGSYDTRGFYYVLTTGDYSDLNALYANVVVPAFVIC